MKEQHKKESPVLSLLGMGGGGTGTALGGLTLPKTYVDDVFSPYVYKGTSSDQSFNNGIDLDGEGGLVWIKGRIGSNRNHILTDTARGFNKQLTSNIADQQYTSGTDVKSFNSNGFTVGVSNSVNASNTTFASWTFRKAPGFFDVVTYTGDSDASRTISHSLGSTPGMIMIKCTSQDNRDWVIHHRSLGFGLYMILNTTSKALSIGGRISAADANTFTPGSDSDTNQTGKTYVAYIFAHDDAQYGTGGDESIIKCGSYTGNGSTNGPEIDLGFEPQFLFVKCSSRGGNQYGGSGMMLDVVRGIPTFSSGLACVAADESNDEATDNNIKLNVTSTGFKLTSGGAYGNDSGGTYTYMAIRRPNKPPEAGTEVFATAYRDSSEPVFNSGFPVDFAFEHYTPGGNSSYPGVGSRLIGNKKLTSSSSAAEANNNTYDWDYMDGWNNVESAQTTIFSHMFKRAPGFMDVVAYTGKSDTAGLNVTHNLGVVPELVFFKRRDYTKNWYGYSSVTGTGKVLYLDTDLAAVSDSSFIPTTPTSTELTVNSYSQIFNQDSTFIAYLFATLPGISKVGSYSGTGNAINVPCGFTNGARFVLIKRTDGSGNVGDWYVWDSVRGIVSGNDPYILLNTTAAQVTNTDYVDPLTSGFTVTASAPAALNASGGTYLFLAIA